MQNAYFKSMKISRRKEDDIALVNGAFYVEMSLSDGGGRTVVIKDAEFVYGGMSATAVFANKTRTLITDREWSEAMLDDVYMKLLEDLPMAPNAPGGMVKYRKTLALR